MTHALHGVAVDNKIPNGKINKPITTITKKNSANIKTINASVYWQQNIRCRELHNAVVPPFKSILIIVAIQGLQSL